MIRPTMTSIWMGLAQSLAKRGTCKRKQVGTVITTMDLEQVLAVGYNGNAKGFPNTCDTDLPGKCGCLHSEMNALVKTGSKEEKVAFITMSPCSDCAKLLINSNVKKVYFRELYRDLTGLTHLMRADIKIYLFTSEGIEVGPVVDVVNLQILNGLKR